MCAGGRGSVGVPQALAQRALAQQVGPRPHGADSRPQRQPFERRPRRLQRRLPAWRLGARRRGQFGRRLGLREPRQFLFVARDRARERHGVVALVFGVEQQQVRVAIADDRPQQRLGLGPHAARAARGGERFKAQPGARHGETRQAAAIALFDHVRGARLRARAADRAQAECERQQRCQRSRSAGQTLAVTNH